MRGSVQRYYVMRRGKSWQVEWERRSGSCREEPWNRNWEEEVKVWVLLSVEQRVVEVVAARAWVLVLHLDILERRSERV